MRLSEAPGAFKQLRNKHWKFQLTFHTPFDDLQRFVTTILSADADIHSASVTIYDVVFDPTHLVEVLKSHSIVPGWPKRGTSFVAANQQEVEVLLCAVLADWIDFVFAPEPGPFLIYADHHGYATFYAARKSNLNRVTGPLAVQGFQVIRDFQRQF